MPYITTIFLLIVIGGVFYATKFPERQFPGESMVAYSTSSSNTLLNYMSNYKFSTND